MLNKGGKKEGRRKRRASRTRPAPGVGELHMGEIPAPRETG